MFSAYACDAFFRAGVLWASLKVFPEPTNASTTIKAVLLLFTFCFSESDANESCKVQVTHLQMLSL